MNKEFAPYTEAFELKELGFDEPTLYHWHSSCKTHPFTNEICNPSCRPKTNSGIKSIGEENHVWSAPTFSQCFRFFRKKHNLFSSEVYDRGLNNGKIPIIHSYSFRILNLNNFEDFYGNVFKTYEEAELACLRKLIEIVKTKQ